MPVMNDPRSDPSDPAFKPATEAEATAHANAMSAKPGQREYPKVLYRGDTDHYEVRRAEDPLDAEHWRARGWGDFDRLPAPSDDSNPVPDARDDQIAELKAQLESLQQLVRASTSQGSGAPKRKPAASKTPAM